jgi:outer membrane protein TolC
MPMQKAVFKVVLVSALAISSAAFGSDFPGDKGIGFISFSDAEKLSIENSHTVAAQGHVVHSAKEIASSVRVRQLPMLDFDATSKFVDKIGRIQFPGVNREVGEHTNWSVGPTLSWMVWDTGSIEKKARGLKQVQYAEGEALENDRRTVLLNARTAYVGVQLAKEQVRLVSEALRLARAQYADVLDKKNAGTADLFDLTVAHQEVVDHEKELESAQGDLAVQKRTLLAALGLDSMAEDADKLDVEPIKTTLACLSPKADTAVDVVKHPQVKELEYRNKAATYSAKSVMAKYWPELTLVGRSSYDHPNLGQDATVQQNYVELGLSLPLFDWGKLWKEAKGERYLAKAAVEEKNQAIIDLSRETSETRERISTLKNLQIASARAVKDADEVARLSYDSYNAGRIIYLDVQRANVKDLAAKVDAANVDAELAVQIARLLALAESEDFQ